MRFVYAMYNALRIIATKLVRKMYFPWRTSDICFESHVGKICLSFVLLDTWSYCFPALDLALSL